MKTILRVVSAMGLLLAVAQPAQAQQRLRFSAFGDFTAGATGGGYADAAARTMFENFGADVDPVNTSRGFGLTGVDFIIISDMTEEFTFMGELNLQAARGGSGEIELDVERFFMDYQISPKFNLQAGLFFTPIGFNNRFLYARAWLMNSIQIPDFYEEELNLVPTHTIGVAAYGEFSVGKRQRINYIVSLGNGRAAAPDGAVYARDPSSSKEATVLVEWLIPGYQDSRIGVSGWRGSIETVKVDNLGDVVDAGTADSIKMRETGLDAFVVFNTRRWSFNGEFIHSWQKDVLGNLPQEMYLTKGGMAEFSLHLGGGRLHPFVRYDQTSLPVDGGPYLSLREDGDQFSRVFIPEFQAVLTGAAYDVNMHLRLKAEYVRHLDGPRKRNGLSVQAAFGF